MGRGEQQTTMDITREDAAWDEPEETREIPPVQAPGSWDYEADVAIVGGGGAGLCAAALRNGASVIILEKQDETGGHSQHAGAAAVFNTRVSRKAGLKFDREAAFKSAPRTALNCSDIALVPLFTTS